jgi:mannose-6-phosphate isomerase-like protein (cupin superfamily)
MIRSGEHRRTDKPWGYELLIALNEHYALKEIGLNEGQRTSLQSHDRKTESIYLLEGRAGLELEDERGTITQSEVAPGDSYTVVVGRKHRVTAITDIRFVEVSTPELDDVRRYDDDYGRGVE